MKPTKVLQEIRKMRFEEAYEGWNAGRLSTLEGFEQGQPFPCPLRKRVSLVDSISLP